MEEQFKRLTDHYLPLIESTDSNKDVQSTKVTFLRELLLFIKAQLSADCPKDIMASALDMIANLVSEGGEKGQRKLPIDLTIANGIGAAIEGFLNVYNDTKALEVFYALIVNYPKVTMNIENLTNIMSTIVLLQIDKDTSALNKELLERINAFYSSYSLEYHDQLKMFQNNISQLFPAIIQTLGRNDKDSTFLYKILQSLFLIPLAKDMCNAFYNVENTDEAPK